MQVFFYFVPGNRITIKLWLRRTLVLLLFKSAVKHLMIVFERIFAAYYFMFLHLRKINRSRIEDFQATSMICVIQFFILLCFSVLILKMFDISYKQKIPLIISLIITGILIFSNYRYFLSNRDRRNKIIDDYRILNDRTKRTWTALALLLFLIPCIIFPFIFN